MSEGLFRRARWIWNDSDPYGHDYYLQARCDFDAASAGQPARLRITADAYYQVWLNGQVVGHGPSKSAEGTRFVDDYDVTPLLRQGPNRLEVLGLSVGVSTMSYCVGEAGLIFELEVGGQIAVASGEQTLVRPDPRRQHPTVRRWILPCIEDVDAAAETDAGWTAARVVERRQALRLRRVPLPTRQRLEPQRPVLAEVVDLPNFSLSFRHKRYLVPAEELRRHNHFSTPAYVVTDIHSPVEQELQFVPTMGSFKWYFDGKLLFEGSGWGPWNPAKAPQDRIRLKAGANRLIGLHQHDHFPDMSLAGFTSHPVEFRNPFGPGAFQVIPLPAGQIKEGDALLKVDWDALRPHMPAMRAEDTLIDANAYDRVSNGRVVDGSQALLAPLMRVPLGQPLELPAVRPGQAARLVLDLGLVHNGWIELDVEGQRGDRVILSFMEAADDGPPLRIQWPGGCNSALTYRLRDGRQRFESFHPYGVRHIAIHSTSQRPVKVHAVRVYTANCGSRPQGHLLAAEPLLNEIYQVAQQTVISAVDDTYTDCVTFEQVNWNFDNRTAWQGEVLCIANHAVARHSMLLCAEDPQFKGLVRSHYPSAWDNYIPLWSFHWIMWCRDYWRYSGEESLLAAVYPRIVAGLDEALGRLDDRGLLSWRGVWHFFEWGHGRDDNHAINTAEQAGLVGAIDAALELSSRMGGASVVQVERWQAARRRLVAAANELLWDPKRQAYVDSLHEDGTPSPVVSQATNAAMAVFGIADEPRRRELARRIASPDCDLLPFGSPYGLYYVLELLDSVGDVESIFRYIRHRWGDMIRAGDRTCWEHFSSYGHLGWPTRSRCHPFASYVIKYLVKYLLGIELLDVGFRRFRVEPRPPAGLESCQGSIPTPAGLIRVGWRRDNGRINVNVDHPAQLERVR